MYSVQVIDTAANLALAIAAIPEWTELVEVAEVDGGYWLITEPDDDAIQTCCCDCHNVVSEAADSSMYMSLDRTDFVKGVNDALDALGTVLKTVKR